MQGSETKFEILSHFTKNHKTTPDLAHSLYQIQNQQLRISSSINNPNRMSDINKQDLIEAEIKARVKTAKTKEIDVFVAERGCFEQIFIY